MSAWDPWVENGRGNKLPFCAIYGQNDGCPYTTVKNAARFQPDDVKELNQAADGAKMAGVVLKDGTKWACVRADNGVAMLKGKGDEAMKKKMMVAAKSKTTLVIGMIENDEVSGGELRDIVEGQLAVKLADAGC